MRLNYENFNADDLRGSTLADYLVNVEADFEIAEGSNIIYAEPAFPVAELARELIQWLSAAKQEAEDFCLASLSFEDPGAVRILYGPEGWLVGSALTPEKVSSPQSWQDLTAAIDEFIGQVRSDLGRLEVNADFVLGTLTRSMSNTRTWPPFGAESGG